MWLSYVGSYQQTRHSKLSHINGDTLNQLGVGWVHEMENLRGAEATSLVMDRVMYVTGL